MNKAMTHRLRMLLPLAALLAVGCSKGEFLERDVESGYPYEFLDNATVLQEDLLAVATLRSRDGIRYLQLDPRSVGYVLNPDEVAGIPDGTRIFVQYKAVSVDLPDFCTEAVWVDWAMRLDVGERGTEVLNWAENGAPVTIATDPVDIVPDWITSLEDGFLTLHYTVMASGDKKHRFLLHRGGDDNVFYLVHDAQGDTEGSLTDGIVCFPVEDLLPDTGGKTVTLHLYSFNLKKTLTELTVEYRTPQ